MKSDVSPALQPGGPLEWPPVFFCIGIVARDRMDCTRADLILFNLVEQPERLSAGTCIEIGWGDAARIPMVAAITPGSVWDHPMIRQMVLFIVPTLDEAIELIPTILMPERLRSAYQVN